MVRGKLLFGTGSLEPTNSPQIAQMSLEHLGLPSIEGGARELVDDYFTGTGTGATIGDGEDSLAGSKSEDYLVENFRRRVDAELEKAQRGGRRGSQVELPPASTGVVGSAAASAGADTTVSAENPIFAKTNRAAHRNSIVEIDEKLLHCQLLRDILDANRNTSIIHMGLSYDSKKTKILFSFQQLLYLLAIFRENLSDLMVQYFRI